jgi:hypothetical protein
MVSNELGFDISILLDINVPSLDEVVVGLTPNSGDTPLLTLEDLDSIDWDLIASSTLGIMDPIGQLREWLASVLAGFVDTIKRAFEAIISPVKSAVDSIWSVLSGIPALYQQLSIR